jgi:hypothetical protein
LRQQQGGEEWKEVGGLVWGQDEMNVIEDLIAGWDPEMSGGERAEEGKVVYEEEQGVRRGAKL